MKKIFIVFIFALLISGCGYNGINDKNSMDKKETQLPETLHSTQQSEKTSLQISNEVKTIIEKPNEESKYNTSYMIISRKGTVILLDPIQIPDSIMPDIIIVTHGHGDHYDGSAKEKESTVKSMYQLDEFVYDDVKVFSIASSHGEYSISEKYPNNVIYVFEVDGMKIACFGDIGQKELSQKQLDKMGKIDVAIMPLIDMPEYGLKMENSLNILNQVKPSIVIPTHCINSDKSTIKKELGSYETIEKRITINKEDLKTGSMRFIRLY